MLKLWLAYHSKQPSCASAGITPRALLPFLRRHFEVKSREDPADSAALFSVPDFVGDACKAVASRIRGAVASVQFDDFHKVGT